MQNNIENIAEQTSIQGQKIDLTGCCYGLHTRTAVFLHEPQRYYYFLAGLVHSQRLTRILELGTNYGGAIMSMSRGLHREDFSKSILVTVDKKDKNPQGFMEYPYIRRIQGDVLDRDVIQKTTEHFNRDVDLIFIDMIHTYEHTKTVMDIYTSKLRPKYLVLDDILLNDSMKTLWSEMIMKFGSRAFDATVLSGRESQAGFGLIQWS